MYPVVFSLGGLDVTSFGVMVAAGALVGLWVLRRELRAGSLPESTADVAVWALLAGLAGAKLLYVAEHAGEDALLRLLTSRGGLSWFGGFAAGGLVGIALLRWRRHPVLASLAAASPALALGHAIGRLGCFLVGDDYGRPTDLPWGVAFPEGVPPTTVPVHPTQLYEAAFLAALAVFLVGMRRRGAGAQARLGAYLWLAGAGRFAIEFLRVNPRVFGDLTVAQAASLAAVATGTGLLIWSPRCNPRLTPPVGEGNPGTGSARPGDTSLGEPCRTDGRVARSTIGE